MERRLLKAIINPAMITVWITGLWLGFASGYLQGAGWLHAKIGLVILMSAFHGFLAARRSASQPTATPGRLGFTASPTRFRRYC